MDITETVETSYTDGLEVVLKYRLDEPTVCRVYRNGILVFVGEDYFGRRLMSIDNSDPIVIKVYSNGDWHPMPITAKDAARLIRERDDALDEIKRLKKELET